MTNDSDLSRIGISLPKNLLDLLRVIRREGIIRIEDQLERPVVPHLETGLRQLLERSRPFLDLDPARLPHHPPEIVHLPLRVR